MLNIEKSRLISGKTFIKIFILSLILGNVTYSQMNQQWASRYNGPRGYDDFVTAMSVDVSGNVIVTGYAIDSIAGTTPFMRFATVKYNSSGVQQWSAIYHGPADTTDRAWCIGVDAAGNVYVTGSSAGTNTGHWATIKYNSYGVQQWIQFYSGLGIGGNSPRAMKIDAMGNLYITGFGVVVSGQSIDYVTIKYNTNGVQQWISTYSYYIPNGEDEASAIAIDNIGNVYVTGRSYSTNGGGHYDIATIKYNSSGAQQWVQRHLGGASAILTDNLGNVFVAGSYVIKYNSSGVMQWDKSGGYSTSIVLDGSGSLYTANNSGSPSYYTRTVKYNTSGDSLWSRNIVNSYYADVPKIAFDNCLGYVYLSTINNSYNYLTVRYNSYGDSLWSGIYTAPGNGYSIPTANTVDGLGNFYVTGISDGNGTYRDYATVKYTPSSFFIHTAKKNNLNKPINDNQSTSDSTFIDCSLMNYTTADVNVKLENITHTRDSDLEIYLVHNTTTTHNLITTTTDTLVYQAGGTGQNFINTVLNDSASTSISNGTAPFTGSYRPHKPLSQFNGQGINGTWILKIYDRATGNTGTLNAWSIDFLLSSTPNGIHNISNEIPKQFSLSQNYPNPFNPSTTIHFSVGTYGYTSLRVFNLLGQEVATLVNDQMQPGSYSVQFGGKNLSSGVYFYRLTSGGQSLTKKLLLTK